MTITGKSQGFPKREHLVSRRTIDKLYTEGHRLRVYPYNIAWIPVDDSDVACQLLIVVPKRRFKHAVDRNRMKRLTRECYRKRKESLLQLLGDKRLSIALSLVYVGNELTPYDDLAERMNKLIARLETEVSAL